jgi:2-methylisocitrate lyase-like PEP mutase family enzyme
MKMPTRFRRALESPGLTVIEAVGDALSTLVAVRAGCAAVCMDGRAVASNLFGKADAGLLSLAEMEFVVARTTDVSPVPVMVDAGSGYGNAANVAHAVQRLEAAGAAAIMIGDPVSAHRGTDGAEGGIVSIEEMVAKIRAALNARADPHLCVVARSIACGVEGIEAGIERANRYAAAGADVVLADGLSSLEMLARVGSEVSSPHRMTDLAAKDMPRLPLARLEALGFACALHGLAFVRAQALGTLQFFMDFRQRGNEADLDLLRRLEGSPFEDWYEFTGFDSLRALEERYLPAKEVAERYASNQPGYFVPKGGA